MRWKRATEMVLVCCKTTGALLEEPCTVPDMSGFLGPFLEKCILTLGYVLFLLLTAVLEISLKESPLLN